MSIWTRTIISNIQKYKGLDIEPLNKKIKISKERAKESCQINILILPHNL